MIRGIQKVLEVKFHDVILIFLPAGKHLTQKERTVQVKLHRRMDRKGFARQQSHPVARERIDFGMQAALLASQYGDLNRLTSFAILVHVGVFAAAIQTDRQRLVRLPGLRRRETDLGFDSPNPVCWASAADGRILP